MKTCTQCHKKKSLEEFAWKNRSKNTHASECKLCHRIWRKRYYQNNKASEIGRTQKRREEIRQLVASHKKVCMHCGENHPAVLQFHHINASDKDDDIAHMVNRGWSNTRIKQEIAKCIVLCANCHNKEHYKP